MCFTGYVTHLEVADLRVTYVCSKATRSSFLKGKELKRTCGVSVGYDGKSQ